MNLKCNYVSWLWTYACIMKLTYDCYVKQCLCNKNLLMIICKHAYKNEKNSIMIPIRIMIQNSNQLSSFAISKCMECWDEMYTIVMFNALTLHHFTKNRKMFN